MFYKRQKELLYLLSRMNKATAIRLQAMEFLANLTDSYYDFIPLKYGPTSLMLEEDLLLMQKHGYIVYNEPLYSLAQLDYPQVESKRQLQLDEVLSKFAKMSSRELLRLIHQKHPNYATQSEIAANLLNKSELQKLQSYIPSSSETCLFTIGYQGRSLEKYLMLLYENSVKMLIDIRFNSHSMKLQFSGTHLQKAAARLNIGYLHIPSLGISHQHRDRFEDKKQLFAFYQKEILSQKSQEISQVFELLDTHKRIALTCYEAEPEDCHRYYLSHTMSEQSSLDVKHL